MCVCTQALPVCTIIFRRKVLLVSISQIVSSTMLFKIVTVFSSVLKEKSSVPYDANIGDVEEAPEKKVKSVTLPCLPIEVQMSK